MLTNPACSTSVHFAVYQVIRLINHRPKRMIHMATIRTTQRLPPAMTAVGLHDHLLRLRAIYLDHLVDVRRRN